MLTEIRTDRDRRRAVGRWRRSGMAAHDFAPLLGVSSATLYAWSRRFRGGALAGGDGEVRGVPGAARLIELVPAADPAAGTDPGDPLDAEVSLALRCGRTLRFPSRLGDDLLRRLIAVAESA